MSEHIDTFDAEALQRIGIDLIRGDDTVEQYPGFTEPYRLALAHLISQADS